MTSREIVKAVANRTNTDTNPFWTGHPSPQTEKSYLEYIKGKVQEDIFQYFNDDCRWYCVEGCYKHPDGKPMFDTTGGREKLTLSQPGCFAEATLEDIKNFEWPDPDYLDFTAMIEKIKSKPDTAIFSGMWSCFFHVLCDFFGMEEYFVKMHIEPEIVEAATRHVVDFYVEANERFLAQAGDCFDIMFIGNDFGTQRDLLVSPDKFKEFILPGFQKIIQVGKKYNKKIMLHSCGSIYRVIPDLIESGVDILHPIQAKAANMDADTLAREFKGDVAFCGGLDTQDLLVNCNPAQIREEVLRLRETFGSNYIVSPSHEEILPNISIENMIAAARAAKE